MAGEQEAVVLDNADAGEEQPNRDAGVQQQNPGGQAAGREVAAD